MISVAVSSLELQKAVYSTLSSGTYAVYEIIPPNTEFPYIQIGEETLTTNNTKTSKGTIHNITIHTWSKGSSSANSKILNDYVAQTLLNGFTVNGFLLDNITLEMMQTLKETDTDATIFHGVLQFDIKLMEV